MFKRIIHLAFFVSFVALFYHLTPTTPSAAAEKQTATATLQPSATASKKGASPTPTASPTVTPTATPSGPHAWLDEAIDLQAFSPIAAFKVHFYTPMNPASIGKEAALLIFPWADGKLTWEEDNTLLTFQPNSPLTPGQAYHVYLNPKLTDTKGTLLTGSTDWKFTVGSAPQVLSQTSGEPADSPGGPITILTFDRPMDTESITAALHVQPALPFSLTWQGESSLKISLTQSPTPGQQLAFTLAGSATGADGIPMVTPYHWYISSPAFTVKLDETLIAAAPEPQMALIFSHPMNSESVSETIRFSPALTATLAWSESTYLQIIPADPADLWWHYQISFEGELLDEAGNLLPLPETITYAPQPPISQNTQQGARLLSDTAAPLEIDFLIAVDQASVEAGFAIEPKIKGSFEWADNLLSFQPEKPLLAGETYTITLNTSIKNDVGHLMLTEPYTVVYQLERMRTDTYATHFGERGANIQVVDADGTRAIQFQHDGDSGPLSFTLYQFDLPTFIDHYNKNYEVGDWRNTGKKMISTEGGKLVSYWEWSSEIMDERAIIPEVYLPADASAGLYILNMNTSDTLLDQLFVVITRNTLVVKKSGDELLAWVSDINGASVGNLEMQVYGSDNQKLLTGKTDANGLYRASVPGGVKPMLVVAHSGEDYAISGLESSWGWGWGTTPAYKAYPYTDRPIYQPGQTVYFKAIVRADQDVQYSLLPTGTPVIVRVRDPRDNVLQTFELSANAFGSVNGEFQLGDGAALGVYDVEVVIDDDSYSTSQTFKVQDYRKPDMQVSIASDAAEYVAGDPITITVEASYFFGKPVMYSHVTVKRYRTYGWNWYPDSSAIIAEGETDENGRFTTQTTATFPDYYGYSGYGTNYAEPWGLEVTLEDESGQAVSSSAVIKVYQAAEIVKLDLGSWLKAPAKAFDMTASVTAIDGKPVEGRELMLEVRQWDPDGYGFNQVISSSELTQTNASGQALTSLTIEKSGYYEIRVSGQDSRGNDTSVKRYIFIYEKGQPWANAYSSNELKISADQTEVQPKGKVRLLIESTFDGPAMLTFERGRVNRAKPITLTAPLTIVDVEMLPEDAPNVYITVNAWQAVDRYPAEGYDEDYERNYWDSSQADSTLRRASVEVRVDASDKALNVAIQSDREIYTPRQSAIFTMTVTNAQGRPVEAELSLALVDEAIYALSDELTPAIFNAFYQRRDNTVYTYHSMAPYRSIRAFDAGRGGGGGGGDSASGFRSDFPDIAAWYPTIMTDKNGVAIVKIDIPDNLTSWRVVVRAVTKTTLVGEASDNITTQKPIVVRPQLPRTLTVGDEVTISAFVHNYSDTQQELLATIQVNEPSLEITGTLLQTVSLAPGQVQLVSWQAKALAAGEPQVLISAFLPSVAKDSDQKDRDFGDAVQMPLSIRPLAVPEVNSLMGTFQGTFDTSIIVPTHAISQSVVRIDLSRSVAGSLLDGLDYLTGYPYGCVEQTMSRALPNAVVGRAYAQLGIDDAERKAALLPLIRAGLQRLYDYQHHDGGWGWWLDDETDAYQTAWVVFGLAVTAEAGYEVDPQVIAGGAEWLRQNLGGMDTRTAAYALYSMAIAGHGDLAATENLYASMSAELDPFSQAALALAYHELGAAEQALKIANMLAASATQEGGQAYWPQPYGGHYHDKTMSSTTRSTALVLDALVQIMPESKLIPGAVQWLMNQRRPQGWGTTNETAYTILALTDHLLVARQKSGTTGLTIVINGESFVTVNLNAQQPEQSIAIPFELLQSGANQLRIRQVNGSGDVYYRIYQRLYLAESEIAAAGAIQVRREYVTPSGDDPVAAGDIVEVHLFVTIPQDGYYMILEDQLPGGLEALNDKLNNASHEMVYRDGDYYENFYWQEYGYNNKEIHADRVSFFITQMTAGEYEYVYLARATRPGSFSALPAEIYAMYNESLWGRSASGKLVVMQAE